MNQIIHEFYLEHKSNFENNLIIARETSKPEAIHKMRTSMKRLRALFQLIQILTERGFNAKKYMKKGRGIFKLAGVIRELQVEEMLVYSYEESLGIKFMEYSQYLFNKENREISKFKENQLSYKKDRKIFNEQVFLKALKSISIKDIQIRSQGFVNLKLNALTKLNKRGKTIENIHQNRTILKQIYYLYDILTKLSGWSELLGMEKEEMRQKEQEIGNWHDKVNSFQYLSSFFDAKEGRKNEEYLLLMQLIKNDMGKMKSDIINHLYTGQTLLWE